MKRALRRRAGLWLALLATLTAVTAQEMPGGGIPRGKAVTTRSSTFMSVPAEAFFTTLRGEPQIRLINVYIPYKGELPGTDAFIAFDRIARQRDRLPQDKAAAVAVYCMSGRMSEVASRTLRDLGYTNVTELRGGMIAWQRAGFPLTGRLSTNYLRRNSELQYSCVITTAFQSALDRNPYIFDKSKTGFIVAE